MKIKRPRHFFARQLPSSEYSLADFLGGGSGAVVGVEWRGTALHLSDEIAVDLRDLALIDALPAEGWMERSELDARFGAARTERLLQHGLLLGDHPEHESLRLRDDLAASTDWWAPAAMAHRLGRWRNVDAIQLESQDGKRTLTRMMEANGAPPPETIALRSGDTWQALPRPRKSALDDLLSRRATCRNFDPDFRLPLSDLSDVLHRVFGAQAAQELAPGAVALKKNSPSGGGLHPIEAYLFAQRVEGLAPGLYHYQPVAHALEPMRMFDAGAAAPLAHELVAGQRWFANAPVLLLMAARFQRNFWKYRNHAKAWKVIQLDAGHLSQNLYLSATEQGYGAFVTGAINDECAERLFELDGLSTGAVAVCGFGRRADTIVTAEFDPLGKAVR